MKLSLTELEGRALVHLAREAVTTYLRQRKTIQPDTRKSNSLNAKSRVFVTILSRAPSGEKSDYELRGCIGFLEARYPLATATVRAAISAAVEDPRFPPLGLGELENVIFEVNILSELVRLKAKHPAFYPRMIKIGADGLIISKGEYRGILLPEVPVEWGWNAEEFITQCSLKAGLYPDAWLDEDTKVYKFQSEIYRETDPMGEVQRVKLLSNAPTSPQFKERLK